MDYCSRLRATRSRDLLSKVCCATPSWVVGLAMLGLGVSTSLALETMGPILSGLGFGTLTLTIVFLAWRKARLLAGPSEVKAHA